MANISSLKKGLVLDLPLNGSVKDLTPYGNNGTRTGFTFNNGSAVSGNTWTNGKFDNYKGLQFNNSNFLLVNDNLDSMTDFSIGAWVKTFTTGGTWTPILVNGLAASTGVMFTLNGANLDLLIPNSSYETLTGSTSLSPNTWYYATCTYNSTTTSGTVYINGVDDGQMGFTKVSSGGDKITIGASDNQQGSWADTYFSGCIANVRLWNRALSAAEIGSEMNSPIAVAGSGLVGCWEMNEGHGTIAYDTNDTVKGKWSDSKAMTFDGTEYININDNSNLDIGTEDFSFATWFYPNVDTNTHICGKDTYAAGNSYIGYFLQYSASNDNKISFVTRNYRSGAGPANTLTSTNTYNSEEWIHTVGVRNSGSLTLYVNGALDGTLAESATTDISNSVDLKIGKFDELSNNYFKGNILQTKMYNRALSALEVTQLYNQSKGGYLK